jgi:hypothetical protein
VSEIDALNRLRAAVRDSGSPLASSLGPAPAGWEDGAPDPASVAATGPRAAPHREDLELAVAAVHEGYALHYGHARAIVVDDPDLALLAGDRLYAFGLERLAAIGDLEAIGELADIISLAAQAHGDADPQLAQAAWDAGSAAIGWGAGPDVERAKAAARNGDPRAADALRCASRARRSASTI